ncbi:MAG TPA: hemolysin family protein [Longimicrobiales bacterium]|nr:hemolysin family protein [Longimicrobiales bacterium]
MEGDAHAALTIGEIFFRLLIALLLVAANGFFVASEFALVGARRTRIEQLAADGNRRARLAHTIVTHLDHYISATQLGITLASLALGWVGESTLAVIFVAAFDGMPEPFDVLAAHGVAVALAFTLITVMHIVFGELAPKSVALLFPETVSLWTAGPLLVFSRIFTPFIILLNGAANLLLRMMGLRAATEMERVHRPEEIEMLVDQSYESGLLSKEPVDMIRGVFDLSETAAGEVMTPRTEMVAIPATHTVSEAADAIIDQGHSRLPVYGESLDNVVGVVLAREIWRARRDGIIELAPLIRPATFVPESKSVEALLRDMQTERIHLAIVVDEFGGTAGLVTLEDLVEEIVGEIADEHEEVHEEILEIADGGALLSGTVSVVEINERYGLELPEQDYTTVAGYTMGRLGRLARPGDEVRFDGGRLRVLAMDGRRVLRMALLLDPPAAPDGDEDAWD